MTAARRAPVREPALTISPVDAAALLGISPETLRGWRLTGRGPRYVKLGGGKTSRIRYRRSAIEAFLDDHTRSSTSDVKVAK